MKTLLAVSGIILSLLGIALFLSGNHSPETFIFVVAGPSLALLSNSDLVKE